MTRPAPGPPDVVLPAPALDSHCHLEMMPEPVEQILAEAHAAGIRRVVTIGTDVESSRWAVDCASVHADVYAAVAIHPTAVEEVTANAASSPGGLAAATDAVLAQIEALAARPEVRAIGETGLDYYWDRAAPKVQQEWFRAHIEIAKRAGKALVIHDRDAHEDVLRILDEQGAPEKVVFHCFSGDAQLARRCVDAGYVMSFAGTVTFANAQPLRDAAALAPASLLLAETDAPFLTPVPHRGKSNAPWLTAHTLRKLAEVKQMDLAELCDEVSRTAERIFGPW
jgi:TatD DNase family protein